LIAFVCFGGFEDNFSVVLLSLTFFVILGLSGVAILNGGLALVMISAFGSQGSNLPYRRFILIFDKIITFVNQNLFLSILVHLFE
jgi:hypothetical protein